MTDTIIPEFRRNFIRAGIAAALVLLIGTIGYWLVGEQKYSVLDCLYMTVITVLTIGYGEIIDLSQSPIGRVFTMVIAFAGIGILTYILSSVTAFIVEGHMKDIFLRRKMESLAKRLNAHYIICGAEGEALHIADDLAKAGRSFAIVREDWSDRDQVLRRFGNAPWINGDPTDDTVLLRANVTGAMGLFAVSGDDTTNLVLCLTARQLQPRLRIVAQCIEMRNAEKLRRAGADAVVSPPFIGGMRMASEMIRPTVVSFLDIMLRERDKRLRVEELLVPATDDGVRLSSLSATDGAPALILAVRSADGWVYNPPKDFVLKAGDSLVVMVTGQESPSIDDLRRIS